MFIDASTFNDVTGQIIGAAIEVHRTLGPGLLESIYVPCLQYELGSRRLRFVAQRAIPIIYKGTRLDASYRVDLTLEDLVVVEVKSVAALLPVYQAQVLTYMRLTDCPAGLLINFNVPRLMDGVKRLISARDSAAERGIGKQCEGVHSTEAMEMTTMTETMETTETTETTEETASHRDAAERRS